MYGSPDMGADLVHAPEAELDITEAYVWYETRETGLGEGLLRLNHFWSWMPTTL